MKVKELINELQKLNCDLDVEFCGYTYRRTLINDEFEISVEISQVDQFRGETFLETYERKVALITIEDKE